MNFFLLLSFFCTLFCVNAQYGGQPSYQQPPQYYPPATLNDNFVCSIQANYDLFGQNGKHHRPTTNFCQDAYKFDGCERCCRMAARIQGTNIKEESIIGFNIVLEKQPLCICCSPNSAASGSNGY